MDEEQNQRNLGSLRRELSDRSKSQVLCLGTGVTSALTGRKDLGWQSVVARLIGTARRLAEDSQEEGELDTMRGLFESAFARGDVRSASTVIELVIQKMNKDSKRPLASWLQETFGSLEILNHDLADTIASFGRPMITTNYDTVLDEALGFKHPCQDEPEKIAAILSGREKKSIGHIHGVWDKVESVVLGSTSYAKTIENKGAADPHKAAYLLQTFLYIGVGQGISDPNFKFVRDSVEQIVGPNSQGRHYILCQQSEFDALRRELKDSDIVPVAYGQGYPDLPDFLKNLAMLTNERSDEVSLAVPNQLLAIESAARRTALLPELQDADGAFQIEPVIMPSEADAFLLADDGGVKSVTRRIDASQGLIQHPRLVISGDSGSGVSSALYWMLLRRSETSETQMRIPISINFDKLNDSSKALRGAVKDTLLSTGAIKKGQTDFPPLSLAIDNVDPAKGPRVKNLAKDLEFLGCEYVVIGCRTEAAPAVTTALSRPYSAFESVTLGRLQLEQVIQLAQLLPTDGAEGLATRARNYVNREHLPATAGTYMTILVLLLRGTELSAGASPATITQQLLEYLLAREVPEMPAHQLTPARRQSILRRYSEKLALQGVGGIPTADFLAFLANHVEQYTIPAAPEDIKKELIGRRILTEVEGVVSFAHTAYASFFAAEQACRNQQFLTTMLGKLVRYSDVLADYAALSREDNVLLARVLEELEGLAQMDSQYCFAHRNLVFVELSADDEQGSANDPDGNPPESGHESAGPSGDSEEFSGGVSSEKQEVSFEEMGSQMRASEDAIAGVDPGLRWATYTSSPTIDAMHLFRLASCIIRESEEIDDRELKSKAIVGLFEAGAQLVNMLENDPDFKDFMATLRASAADRAAEEGFDSGRRRTLDNFMLCSPIFYVIATMLNDFQSDQVDLLIQREFSTGCLSANPARLIVAVLYCLSTNNDLGIERLSDLSEFINMPTVGVLIANMMFARYVQGGLKPKQQSDVRRFLIDCFLARRGHRGAESRHAASLDFDNAVRHARQRTRVTGAAE